MEHEDFALDIGNALDRACILTRDPYNVIGRMFRFESINVAVPETCIGTIISISLQPKSDREKQDALVLEVSTKTFGDDIVWLLIRFLPEGKRCDETSPWRLIVKTAKLPVSYPGILKIHGLGQPVPTSLS